MALQVIGAGFGRTGTMSLKLALERLGFDRCYHMMEVFEHPGHVPLWTAAHRGETIDWDDLFEGYLASVDWPSCNLWREQLNQYPDAKVVLSTRDPERWYQSVMSTIYPSSREARDSEDPQQAAFGQWVFDIIWDRVFSGKMEDKDHCIRMYRNHEKSVRDALSPEKLLVFEAGQGWAPLCEFLGCDVPNEDYPHTNTTAEFLSARPERQD